MANTVGFYVNLVDTGTRDVVYTVVKEADFASNMYHGAFARSGFARVVQRVYKKSPGASATFCHMGHVVMENRNGLVAATEMTQAAGAAERDAAIAMVEEVAGSHRITRGADKFKSNYIRRVTTDSRCFSIGPKCSARVSASQGRGRQQRQGC